MLLLLLLLLLLCGDANADCCCSTSSASFRLPPNLPSALFCYKAYLHLKQPPLPPLLTCLPPPLFPLHGGLLRSS